MNGPLVPWIPLIVAVLLVPFWLLTALFFTLLGRNDSTPPPEGFWRTYVAWLWLSLPQMVMFWAYFGTPLRQVGFLTLFFGMAAVYGLVIGYGQKLPLIGPWIGALMRREARRRDHGVL